MLTTIFRFLLITSSLVFLAGCSAKIPRKNFVLILVDALRADHLSNYGYPRATSPFLDELAAGGLTFERAYSQSSQTFLSTGSLLTSRYFPLMSRSQHVLFPNSQLISELLQENGYHTAAFFTNPHHHEASGFWQGWGHSEFLSPQDPEEKRLSYRRGGNVNTAVFSWLESLDEQEPFFAYVHYMDVHNPYSPPSRYEKIFVEEVGKDKYRNNIPVGDQIPSERDLSYMKSLYDGEIRYVDDLIRDLHQKIDHLFPTSETIFFFISDHGDEFMEHSGLGHGRTVELELLHVPLILSGIKGLVARRVPEVVRNVDIAPTMAELAGIEIPSTFEGRSLLPFSTGQGGGHRKSFARYGGLQSITTDGWHFYLSRRSTNTALYDLSPDPRALTDIKTTKPEIVTKLSEDLGRFNKAYRQSVNLSKALEKLQGNKEPEMDPKIIEQLKALGYLD